MKFDNEEFDQLKKKIDQEEKDIDVQLSNPDIFSDNWLERMLKDTSGIDTVYELFALQNVDKLFRKSLLMIKLKSTKTLFCSVCKKVYFNYIHYLFHINTTNHANNMYNQCTMKSYLLWKDLLEIYAADVANWHATEYTFSKGDIRYQEALQGYDDEDSIPPTTEWMESLRTYIETNKYEELSDRMKKHIMDDLLEKLNNEIALCKICNEAFVTPKGFLDHCLSFNHYELVQSIHIDGPKIVMKYLTIMMNELASDDYLQRMGMTSQLHPTSAEVCLDHVKSISPSVPTMTSKWSTRTGLSPEREEELMMMNRMEGKSMSAVKSLKGGEHLVKLLEPGQDSFSSLVRTILGHPNYEKHHLDYVEELHGDLEILAAVIRRTIDKGIPYCLYCDVVFKDTQSFCDHLFAKSHHDRYVNYLYKKVPSSPDEYAFHNVQEVVKMLLLEFFQRYHFRETSGYYIPPTFVMETSNVTFYCDLCALSFLDFSFYIAHFWSKSHISCFVDPSPLKGRDAYLSLLIKNSTIDQLKNIGNEVIQKYSVIKKPVVLEDRKMDTRDTYLMLFVQLHFGKKYEQWRKRQSFKCDEGTPAEYDETRHVPTKEVIREIDEQMRIAHERAPYVWWDEKNKECRKFRNFFFNFPPFFIWDRLNDHMKKGENKTSFCLQCNLEFRSSTYYFLHFGEDKHPYPKGMDEPMAGFVMLMYIMYSEKRIGVNLDKYLPLTPL
ncbi:hypothetical protein PMAYCL1PPCAC_17662 [Pristionchus mayeri]|uniref:C2H2-type domain-containing protein n=1 Tax=Pristionchus mayeri TaxID=1317129 RepID=A0AAN5CN76_9BILA|nr:hypothetical protein PMAYCL1PPCAC_17662 [Pristionchus mayeri]